VAGSAQADQLIVDTTELRMLALVARTQGGQVRGSEIKAARTIGAIDQTGWDAWTALSKWPAVRGALDALAADLESLARELERRAFLIDLLEQPFNPFLTLPPWLDFHTGLLGLRALDPEYLRLLAHLPPGWGDLTQRQQLSLLDQLPFGSLGYTPLPPPPPAAHDDDQEEDDDGGFFSDVWGGIKGAGGWTIDQGEGFGTQLWDNVTGTIEGLPEIPKAAHRSLVNTLWGVYQMGLPPQMRGGQPPMEGPGLPELLSDGLIHSVQEPYDDLTHGRVGEAAAGILMLVGLKGLKPPKIKIPKVPKGPKAPEPRTPAPHGHPRPWESMTRDERLAFQHSYSRHARELGLPNWAQRNAADLQQQFNSRVADIRENAQHVTVQERMYAERGSGEPAAKTRVRYYEYTDSHGVVWYYYERLSDGKFISAGKSK
jgi:hypothetical protein